MGISAVIFDNDGVLVDSEAISVAVEREVLARIGLDYAHEEFVTRFVGLSDDGFHAALNADCRERLGKDLPKDIGDQFNEIKWPRFEAELKPMKGVAELASNLSIPKAVASSAPDWKLTSKLRLTGLYDYFAPHIYSADLVGAGKPAPDLFLMTANEIGFAPEDCVVIEDSLNGVLAGVAAGMTVWGFAGGGHADEGLATRLSDAGAHEVFANFAEISARL